MLDLLDRVDLGLLWLNAQGQIKVCNQWLVDLAGLQSRPDGQTLTEAFGPEVDPKLLRAVEQALQLGRATRLSHAFHPTPLPLRARRGDPQQRMQQAVDVLPLRWLGAQGCLVQVRDLTEATRREQLLKQQARQLGHDLGELRIAQDELTRHSTRLRELTRLAPVALFETDLQGHLLYTNDRFLSLWNLSPAAILGRHWSALLPQQAALALAAPWAELMSTPDRIQRDVRIATPDADDRWLQLEAGALRNLDGAAFGYLASLVDVTALYRRAQHLEHRAHHDPLTGLPNREKLMQKLEGGLAAAQWLGQALRLIFIDLDGFKLVNDLHGHAAGDAVLQAIGQRARRVIRGEDVIARLAGDEFALMLSDAPTLAQVDAVMDKVMSAITEPIRYGDQWLSVGGSWGLASFPADGTDAGTLLAAADACMYAQKQARKRTQGERLGAVAGRSQ